MTKGNGDDTVGLQVSVVATSPYATLAARQDAERRAAEDIAYRIRLDLGVFFSQNATKEK